MNESRKRGSGAGRKRRKAPPAKAGSRRGRRTAVRKRPAGGAQSVATRARLIEATLRALNERGIAGTSARDIARLSGVNLAGIGYHFGSKDELIAAALMESIKAWLHPALTMFRRTEIDAVQRLLLVVQALQESFERARGMLPVYLEALVAAPRIPAIREQARALFAELRVEIAAQLREQQAAGMLPAWIDPGAMATLQMAAINGLALQAVLDAESLDHRAVAAQALQLLVAARSG